MSGMIDFKPGNMLYPLPVVMLSMRDEYGKDNIITVEIKIFSIIFIS